MYEAAIGTDGQIASLRTLKPISGAAPWPLLDKTAQAAISKWQYEPPLVAGKPATVCITITVTIDVR
jgi:TonB family protein